MSPASEHNRRACSRSPMDLPVTVYHHSAEAARGLLSDFSFAGAFIRTNAQRHAIDDLVTLTFNVDDRLHDFTCHASATVVRTSPEGIGVIFDEYDQDTLSSLRTLYTQSSL
jgi:hypothetical protein